MDTKPDWPLISGLAVAFAALLEAWLRTRGTDDAASTIFVALLTTLPLIVRWRYFKTAVALITAGTLITLAGGDATPLTVAAVLAQTWALYRVAERCRGWVSLLFGALFVFATLADGGPGVVEVALLMSSIAALGVGHSRRLHGEVSAARADKAVLEERARIARELHDVVAHHVSTIAIQADTARLTTAGLPAEGEDKLEAIGQTARDAMTEMRRVLGVLRGPDGGDRAPQPGLDRLSELLETARRAGTPVRLVLEGPIGPLSPGTELTAYRILQEALTNARRHAPGAAVEVSLDYGARALRLRVRDDGPGGAAGDGHGLRGMRERAAMVGGELSAGPADGGGFLVEASLPL